MKTHSDARRFVLCLAAAAAAAAELCHRSIGLQFMVALFIVDRYATLYDLT